MHYKGDLLCIRLDGVSEYSFKSQSFADISMYGLLCGKRQMNLGCNGFGEAKKLSSSNRPEEND